MPSPLSKPPAIFILLSLAAWGAISCGQQSPTSPSADIGPATAVYVMTLADEAPAPPNAPASDPTAAPSPTSPGWPPGPPPAPAPGAPVPTPPSTHFRVSLKIDPEPVPHSGKPITDVAACRNPVMKYTWYYTQYIHAETGVPVTFAERENFFEGRFVSRNGETLTLNGNGTIALHTRWCSGYAKFHYAQTRFKGKDEYGEPIEISGPWVRLLAP
jgi:hypothetical protein